MRYKKVQTYILCHLITNPALKLSLCDQSWILVSLMKPLINIHLIEPFKNELHAKFYKRKLRTNQKWWKPKGLNSKLTFTPKFPKSRNISKFQKHKQNMKLRKTNSWPMIWLLLQDEVLLVRLQEPVDQCLLSCYLLICKISIGLWSPYCVLLTPVYTMKN